MFADVLKHIVQRQDCVTEEGSTSTFTPLWYKLRENGTMVTIEEWLANRKWSEGVFLGCHPFLGAENHRFRGGQSPAPQQKTAAFRVDSHTLLVRTPALGGDSHQLPENTVRSRIDCSSRSEETAPSKRIPPTPTL